MNVKKEKEATNWAELEAKIERLKYEDIRAELSRRSLNSKGVKSVLKKRLMDAVEKEKAAAVTTPTPIQEQEPEPDTASTAAAPEPIQPAPVERAIDTGGGGHAILLSQALRNNDDNELNGLVGRVTDDGVIYRTVKELPTKDVLVFLKYMDESMRQQKLKNLPRWLVWLNKVITVHRAYLATIPDLNTQISKILAWMEVRVRNLDKLLELQGKLNFLCQQVPQVEYHANAKPVAIFSIATGVTSASSHSKNKPAFAEDRDEKVVKTPRKKLRLSESFAGFQQRDEDDGETDDF